MTDLRKATDLLAAAEVRLAGMSSLAPRARRTALRALLDDSGAPTPAPELLVVAAPKAGGSAASALATLIARLEERAAKPPTERTVNERTVAAIHDLQGRFVAFDASARRALLSTEGDVAAAEATVALERRARDLSAARVTFEEGEATARRCIGEVGLEELQALHKLHATRRKKLKKRAANGPPPKAAARQAVQASPPPADPILGAVNRKQHAVRVLLEMEVAEEEEARVDHEEAEALERDALATDLQQRLQLWSVESAKVRCRTVADIVPLGEAALAPLLPGGPGGWVVDRRVGHSVVLRQGEARLTLLLETLELATGTVGYPPFGAALTFGGVGRAPPPRPFVAVVLGHGGYFAAAVFDITGRPLAHKTFQRYVTRRGQGGRQSQHSGRTDTAGSQIRAHHEKKWVEEVQGLLRLWSSHSFEDLATGAPEGTVPWGESLLGSCTVFYHLPGSANTRMLLDSALGQPGCQAQLRRVPFTTHRPTFDETKAVVRQLFAGQLVSGS